MVFSRQGETRTPGVFMRKCCSTSFLCDCFASQLWPVCFRSDPLSNSSPLFGDPPSSIAPNDAKFSRAKIVVRIRNSLAPSLSIEASTAMQPDAKKIDRKPHGMRVRPPRRFDVGAGSKIRMNGNPILTEQIQRHDRGETMMTDRGVPPDTTVRRAPSLEIDLSNRASGFQKAS